MNINLKIRSKDNYYTCTFALVTGSKYIVSFEVEWCNLSALAQKIRKPTLNALYKCTLWWGHTDHTLYVILLWYQNKTMKLYYKIDIMAFVRVYRCMISSLKSVYLSKNTFFYEVLQDISQFLFDDNNEQISVCIHINSWMFSARH